MPKTLALLVVWSPPNATLFYVTTEDLTREAKSWSPFEERSSSRAFAAFSAECGGISMNVNAMKNPDGQC